MAAKRSVPLVHSAASARFVRARRTHGAVFGNFSGKSLEVGRSCTPALQMTGKRWESDGAGVVWR